MRRMTQGSRVRTLHGAVSIVSCRAVAKFMTFRRSFSAKDSENSEYYIRKKVYYNNPRMT